MGAFTCMCVFFFHYGCNPSPCCHPFIDYTVIQPDIIFFSQDFHDTMLEMERLKELHRKALIIQRVMKGFKYRYETKTPPCMNTFFPPVIKLTRFVLL